MPTVELINKNLEIDEAEFERQHKEAVERGEKALREEPRAVSVRYDRKLKRVIIELNNGAAYFFPPQLAQGLSDATEEEISDVKILGVGFGLEWTSLDVHFSVKGLLNGVFGNKRWMENLKKDLGKNQISQKPRQSQRKVA